MSCALFGLGDKDIENIIAVLKKESSIEQAIIFGSRVKGNFKRGSDVDIVLKGRGVTEEIASHISFALNEESPLPYKFDVLTYDTIDNPQLLDHIQRVGQIIYRRNKSDGHLHLRSSRKES